MSTEIINPILYGILFGIPFCLALGPVCILLIQAGINRGFKLALAIVCGVVVGDIVLILATSVFINSIKELVVQNLMVLQICLALFLFCMGIHTILKRYKIRDSSKLVKYNVFILYAAQGFVLDIVNPSNIIVWAGVSSSIIEYSSMQHVLFYTAALITITALMVGIVYSSTRIDAYIKTPGIKKFNTISGLTYIGISLYIALGGKVLRGLF